MQVDDDASVALANSPIPVLERGHWFVNATRDTVRLEYPGLDPLRAYHIDCPVCGRGFGIGGRVPADPGLMSFTAGFDSNADLEPCCTQGGQGPAIGVVPDAPSFRARSTSAIEPEPGGVAPPARAAEIACAITARAVDRATRNPSHPSGASAGYNLSDRRS